MINKIKFVLKTIFKIILWITGIVIAILFCIALLIRVPIIQNKLGNEITHILSKKTGSEINLEKIVINFPKSLFIQGLLIKDVQKDTLLYANKINIEMDMFALLKKNIHINSASINNLTVNLHRAANDSIYNFAFFIEAFKNNNQKKHEKSSTNNKTNFVIDVIDLKNIHLINDDKYAGLFAVTNFKQLHLSVKELDFDQQVYKAGMLSIHSLNQKIILSKTNGKLLQKIPRLLPAIYTENIEIKNTVLNYSDQVSDLSFITLINYLHVDNGNINLNKKQIAFNKLFLRKSFVKIRSANSHTSRANSSSAKSESKNKWLLSANEINLNGNSFSLNKMNKKFIKKSFDVNHFNCQNISLKAQNIFYSEDSSNVNLVSFSASDSNYFNIENLSAKFSMSKNSFAAETLQIQTRKSVINAGVKLKFASLSGFRDSVMNTVLFLNLKNAKVQSSDLLYFEPKLIEQPFFKNSFNSISFSGIINGPLNNLSGKNITFQAADKTTLQTDFNIMGLPYIKDSYFYFPNLVLHTGKRDLINLLGNKIFPKGITIPSDIKVNSAFKGKLNAFKSFVNITSDFGNVYLSGELEQNENFNGTIQTTQLDLGNLLNNKKILGPVSLKAKVKGHGLDSQNIKMKISSTISEFFVNNYNYHNLTIDGNLSPKKYEAKITLKDTNAEFDLDGFINLEAEKEQYKFNLNVKGMDLKKLNLSKEDLKIAFNAVADLKGKDMKTANGVAAITKIVVVNENNKYHFDSVLFASINEKGRSSLTLKSSIIGIKYNGSFAPVNLVKQLKKNINRYFPFAAENKSTPGVNELQNFNLEVYIHNHPIISEALFRDLKEFEPMVFKGSYDSTKKELRLNLSVSKIIYENINVKNFSFNVNSDAKTFNYNLSTTNIENNTLKLDNLIIKGKLENKTAYVNISSIGEKSNKKIIFYSQIIRDAENYKLIIDTSDFIIMNEPWKVSKNNYILFGPNGYLFHNLVFTKSSGEIMFTSINDVPNSDLHATIKNFDLKQISQIIQKDTLIFQGNMNGDVLLKKVHNGYGLITDLSVTDLTVRNILIGNLILKAENSASEKFNVNLQISGGDNNVFMKGYFIPKKEINGLYLESNINSFSPRTLEALSFGFITEASGNIKGHLLIKGSIKKPEIDGTLNFENVLMKPSVLNNQILFKNEKLIINSNQINFNSFTVLDKENHPAVIDGAIKINSLNNLVFDMNIHTNNFLLLNTTSKNNKQYYGRLLIDSRIKLKGSPSFPILNAHIKLNRGSNFTFAVPESKLTTDRGENIVLFNDTLKSNPILLRNEKKQKTKNALNNFDISSTIEIDKKSTLRIMLDPSNKDSLVVKGDAALSFASDPSGKLSLTGTYNISDGSYLVSLENIIKKQFKIESGSTITWNGDPFDADIRINAKYAIRTSPIDLIADQPLETNKTNFGQRYLFLVYLKLRGALLHPEISFEIQLPSGEKQGALAGTISAKLNQLNENPSSLNKQVFALLVLNRFIQENPLQTETDAGSTLARTSVSKFLSAQLNQLSSKIIPGVNLNFDVQSYNEYSSGQAQGRTQLELGLSKQLFNDRVNVQIGGAVDVEGEKVKQNSGTDIAGDVIVEYKITKDGKYRLKGFRRNQYEGAIEGQITETGTGLLYVFDFNKWAELFLKQQKQTSLKDSSGVNQSNNK